MVTKALVAVVQRSPPSAGTTRPEPELGLPDADEVPGVKRRRRAGDEVSESFEAGGSAWPVGRASEHSAPVSRYRDHHVLAALMAGG